MLHTCLHKVSKIMIVYTSGRFRISFKVEVRVPWPEARMRIFQLEFTNISAHWPLLSLKIRQELDPQGPFP